MTAGRGRGPSTTTVVDDYRFTTPVAGSDGLAALTPGSDLDTVLGVLNASGQRIAFNNDVSSSNTDSRVTVNLASGQQYSVGITTTRVPAAAPTSGG